MGVFARVRNLRSSDCSWLQKDAEVDLAGYTLGKKVAKAVVLSKAVYCAMVVIVQMVGAGYKYRFSNGYHNT